tara:strand:+ start:18471 stop:19736 length:1266 start_codon:yes stop_codon:yes gene_type:complete
MAQDPLKVDQLQIEPGETGTRLIDRNAANDAMRFQDAVITSPLDLSQLAGIRNIANVLVVGKSGAGAQYTTIQAALDVVPSAASPTNPYIVIVMPGRYDETVNIVRDGVHLVGIGQPEIRSALEATPNGGGNDHTLIISAQLGTTPQFCLISGFLISNAHDNKAAIRIVGAAASTLLGNSQGLILRDCELRGNAPGGNRPIWGTAANSMRAEGCTFGGNTSAICLFEEMASVILQGCSVPAAVSFRYDDANDEPADLTGALLIDGCTDVGVDSALTPALAIDCDGDGESKLLNTTLASGDRVVWSGDQSHLVQNCSLGVLSLLETATVVAENTTFDSILAPNATAALDIDSQRATAAFAAAATAAVAFDIPQSDTNYDVGIELPSRPAGDESPWITAKATTGFTINFFSAQTMTLGWKATR